MITTDSLLRIKKQVNKLTKILIALIFSILSGCATTSEQTFIDDDAKKQYNICQTHKNSVCTLDFHPNNNLIASSGYHPVVKIWHRENGKILHSLLHPAGVPSLSFSHDGQYLATASYDANVRIWDVNSGTLVKTFSGHQGTVFGIAFSPDDQHLTSVSADDTGRIWNVSSGEYIELKRHQGDVWGIAYSHSGQWLLTGSEDNKVNIWDAKTGQYLSTLNEHSGAVLALEFSHNDKLLASGGDDYIINIWDTQTWTILKSIKQPMYSIYGLSFSPDDSILVSSHRDKGVFGELLQYHFDYGNDGQDITIRFWDVKTGDCLQHLNGHKDDVNKVVFSPDGARVASASVDGSVILWDVDKVLTHKRACQD